MKRLKIELAKKPVESSEGETQEKPTIQLAKEAEKFDLNKWIVGVVSGRNPITNTAFFCGYSRNFTPFIIKTKTR